MVNGMNDLPMLLSLKYMNRSDVKLSILFQNVCIFVTIAFSKTDQLELCTSLILEKCTDKTICLVKALLTVRSLRHHN